MYSSIGGANAGGFPVRSPGRNRLYTHMKEILNRHRTFLSDDLDTIFTVMTDGFGTFILVSNDAHGDVKIIAQRLNAEALLKDYKITI